MRLRVLVAVGLLGLSGCAGASEATEPASPSPSASAAGFTNPVYASNFPDPMIIADPAGGFWAVATNGNDSNVQTLRSADLVSWEQGPDALPELPDWTSAGKVWAPEVVAAGEGGYLLYYTTIGPDPAIQCISVAVGSAAGGTVPGRQHRPAGL